MSTFFISRLSILHNYLIDSSTKLFLNLYLTKFLSTSVNHSFRVAILQKKSSYRFAIYIL